MQRRRDAFLGLLIGLCCFQFVVGWEVLDPRYSSWLWQDDPSLLFLSSNFYFSEPWSWPPGLLHSYGAGYGSSLVFAGSIPILAITLKLLLCLVGSNHRILQFTGAWICGCFLLQGFFAWKIAGLLTRSRLVSCMVCVLLCLAPPLLWRFDYPGAYHDVLMAQWLLLWAYYLLLAERIAFADRCWQWLLLSTLALSIFFYLFAMILPLWALWQWDRVRRNGWRQEWKPIARDAGLALISWLSCAWLCGYFVGSTVGAGNFGFAMSTLATFFVPMGFSRFIPNLAIFDNQAFEYEGFAYLGFGVLLGFFYLLPSRKSPNAPETKALKSLLEPCLLFVLVLVLGFAFTPNIRFPGLDFVISLTVLANLWFACALLYAGRYRAPALRLAKSPLVTTILLIAGGGLAALTLIPLLPNVIKTGLRSSGRFSWLVWYWLIIYFVATASARLGKREFTCLMALVMAVQIADISPAVIRDRAIRLSPPSDPVFGKAELDGIDSAITGRAGKKSALVIIAANEKMPGTAQLALLALRHHMSIDKAYFARETPGAYKAYFARRVAEIGSLQLDPDAAYLIAPSYRDKVGPLHSPVQMIEIPSSKYLLLVAP